MNTATSLLGSTNALLQRHVFSEYLRKWVFLSVIIGIAGGVGAIAFHLPIDVATDVFLGLLAYYAPPLTAGEAHGETVVTDEGRRWVLPLLVALGGLLSGLIVYTLAPEAEGGGADAAIDAFHQKGGRVRSRIP